MHFAYTYVNHGIDKMQEFLDYIFFEVWCNAKGKKYDITVFEGSPELKQLIINLCDGKSIYESQYGSAEFFLKGIKEIYELFAKLSDLELTRLKTWYRINNDIKSLCLNTNPTEEPLKYKDLEDKPKLKQCLYDFFSGLYEHAFLNLSCVRNILGIVTAKTMKNHYDQFVTINKTGKCPFCGLTDLANKFERTQEAYDHYIPKGLYPFATLNMKNLIPMCNKCNSIYKGKKDPLYKKGKRRKVFYPFSDKRFSIQVDISITKSDFLKLTPNDIDMRISSPGYDEEIGSWKDIFEIEERYKSILCGDDVKCWIEDLLSFYKLKKGQESAEEVIQINLDVASKRPFVEKKFLKKSFLEECKKHNLARFLEMTDFV